jgi:RNAse (barnase) inhibitor barstar
MQVIEINGNNFNSLSTFYDEVEKKLTKNLDWKIGRNLNAFNDVLRGGFGMHEYEEPVKINWTNSAKSKHDFGWDKTVLYFESILAQCHPDNIAFVKADIESAKQKKGETLFEIITGIITSHSHIELELK